MVPGTALRSARDGADSTQESPGSAKIGWKYRSSIDHPWAADHHARRIVVHRNVSHDREGRLYASTRECSVFCLGDESVGIARKTPSRVKKRQIVQWEIYSLSGRKIGSTTGAIARGNLPVQMGKGVYIARPKGAADITPREKMMYYRSDPVVVP